MARAERCEGHVRWPALVSKLKMPIWLAAPAIANILRVLSCTPPHSFHLHHHHVVVVARESRGTGDVAGQAPRELVVVVARPSAPRLRNSQALHRRQVRALVHRHHSHMDCPSRRRSSSTTITSTTRSTSSTPVFLVTWHLAFAAIGTRVLQRTTPPPRRREGRTHDTRHVRAVNSPHWPALLGQPYP